MSSVYQQLSLFPLEKRCTRCGLVKCASEFKTYYHRATARRYLRSRCIICTRQSDSETSAKRARARDKQAPLTGEKGCSCCGLVKPLTDFYRDARKARGVSPQCKTCHDGGVSERARLRDPTLVLPADKRCSKCCVLKPRAAFGRRRTSSDGLRSRCKECRRADGRARTRANAAQRPPTEAQSLAAEGLRRCSKCRALKPLHEFYPSKKHPAGRLPDCKDCRRAAVNERAAANNYEYGRAYYAANRDRLRRRMLERWRANRSARDATNKAWKDAHPDWVRTHSKQAKARRRARLARAGGTHTARDIAELYAAQQGFCAYCGAPVGARYHVDHIVPLARGGSNDVGNLCIACPGCNASKRDKLLSEWDRRPYLHEARVRADRPDGKQGQGD